LIGKESALRSIFPPPTLLSEVPPLPTKPTSFSRSYPRSSCPGARAGVSFPNSLTAFPVFKVPLPIPTLADRAPLLAASKFALSPKESGYYLPFSDGDSSSNHPGSVLESARSSAGRSHRRSLAGRSLFSPLIAHGHSFGRFGSPYSGPQPARRFSHPVLRFLSLGFLAFVLERFTR